MKNIVALLFFLFVTQQLSGQNFTYVVLISANAEWKVVKEAYSTQKNIQTPYGDALVVPVAVNKSVRQVLFFHGGWGKIAAAGSTQYVVDTYRPSVLFNLGTCGGFDGFAKKGEVVLVKRTIVYDVIERMGSAAEAIADYSTTLDLSWLKGKYPSPVTPGLLISADQDLNMDSLTALEQRYHAPAADWESGAIAYVAARNHTPLVMLRGVSDIVSAKGDITYGAPGAFEQATADVMHALLARFPEWVTMCEAVRP